MQLDRHQQHHGHQRHEGSARVHEHADEDGHHGERQQVDMEHVVIHQERRHHAEQYDERVGHGHSAQSVEIVASEDGKIDGETEEDDGDI